jgi:hypothetical protein
MKSYVMLITLLLLGLPCTVLAASAPAMGSSAVGSSRSAPVQQHQGPAARKRGDTAESGKADDGC